MIRACLVFLAATLCVLSVAGCSKSGSQGAVANDRLTIALPINPTQLNPILEQNAVESGVDGLMFDELVTLDSHGHDVPDLATVVPTLRNGGISKNGQAELRTHEVDLAWEISGTSYNDLRDAPGVVRQLANSPNYTAIYFNVQRAPLNDVLVRRAIAMATDRAAIVRDDTYGTGTVAIADLSPFSWAYDPSLKPIPYDLAAARALLDRAGWRVGANGLRAKDGRKLALQLAYGQGSQLAQNVAVQMQQMLRAVGIDVQLKSYDYQILYAAAQDGGILNGGKFDMTLYSWVSGSDPDNSSDWLCGQIPPAGNNVTRYCSPEMDRDQATALSTFTRSKRKAAYAKIERLLLRDVPAVFLYYQPLRYAHIAGLRHFSPNGISESWNAAEWRR
ncbi:MAG TPA: ABC transporter substrate-binding protein [Candidatus Dormibacteraeota bacterium]|nr:ABC transporter substrate-binding protein [Candidatus Dormibacteraeota bacterium]